MVNHFSRMDRLQLHIEDPKILKTDYQWKEYYDDLKLVVLSTQTMIYAPHRLVNKKIPKECPQRQLKISPVHGRHLKW
jgi:hypothetical protein